MKELLDIIGVKNAFPLSDLIEFKECYLCTDNTDKVVIAFKMDTVDEMEEITLSIPVIKNYIEMMLDNAGSDNSGNSELPRFLWDMYVVGFYDTNHNTSLEPEVLAKVHRNKFIARKLIIQYEDFEDLKSQYMRAIEPHRYLNTLINDNNTEDPEEKSLKEIKSRFNYIKGLVE
ncbi:hypothetical protein [Virgibacillus sp. L01]|uniref:hypothetical protein n=1 Tax=Virgibacillus sp. L01 TaxID=3457429 RepID=UPI003FD69A1B